MTKKVFKTPEVINPQSVRYFIQEVSPLFSMENKAVPDVVFDADRLQSAGILGQLLIYKFMEYSIKKKCFLRPSFSIKEEIFKEFKKTGFQKLVLSLARSKKVEYESLKYEEEDGIFIAPINLATSDKGDSQDLYAPQIRDYYKDEKEAFVSILCVSEIASNYSAHAEDDTNSILVAKGNGEFFEIACADNGIGIISSLRPTLSGKHSPYEILLKAMERGVTSKKGTNHMGYGLWLVNELVSMLRGELYIFSDKAYFVNRAGKEKKGESPYWRGTITYVKLPLAKRDSVEAVYATLKNRYNRIKIQRYNGNN